MDTRIVMLVAASALVAVPALAQTPGAATPSMTGANAANEGGSENAAALAQQTDSPAQQEYNQGDKGMSNPSYAQNNAAGRAMPAPIGPSADAAVPPVEQNGTGVPQ